MWRSSPPSATKSLCGPAGAFDAPKAMCDTSQRTSNKAGVFDSEEPLLSIDDYHQPCPPTIFVLHLPNRVGCGLISRFLRSSQAAPVAATL